VIGDILGMKLGSDMKEKFFCIVYQDKYKIAVKAKNIRRVREHAPMLVFEWLNQCRVPDIIVRGLRISDTSPPKNAIKSMRVWLELPVEYPHECKTQ
jgi:hypothetical protein